MDRSPTDWELAVLTILAGVDVPGADVVRESIPHLVVTAGCDCGCRSIDLRDPRCLPAEGGSQRFSNAWTPDRTSGFALLLDADGRPQRVEDLSPEHGAAPDPDTLVAHADGALSARWRWVAALVILIAGGCVFAWSVLNGYGPDTSGKDTCAVHASIVETDEDRRQWFEDRCVDAVPGAR